MSRAGSFARSGGRGGRRMQAAGHDSPQLIVDARRPAPGTPSGRRGHASRCAFPPWPELTACQTSGHLIDRDRDRVDPYAGPERPDRFGSLTKPSGRVRWRSVEERPFGSQGAAPGWRPFSSACSAWLSAPSDSSLYGKLRERASRARFGWVHRSSNPQTRQKRAGPLPDEKPAHLFIPFAGTRR